MISETHAKTILTDKLNVSRETFNDLEILVDLLKKWNKTINLVGKSTVDQVWTRHILDSAQMWQFRPQNLKTWVDLGSGGGFPALVLAILAKYDAPNAVFHMIESDARKSAFLRNVSRETFLRTKIHTCRIENAEKIITDVISARALSSVDRLFEYSQKYLSNSTYCLFLKGQSCATELEIARESWGFQSETTKSLSDGSGHILKAWNIRRATK
ncbi:MAG: 16S rRNA (guanine(527)-N(7))-methyltransferase RsmG [Rhodobacterales bacterium]